MNSSGRESSHVLTFTRFDFTRTSIRLHHRTSRARMGYIHCRQVGVLDQLQLLLSTHGQAEEKEEKDEKEGAGSAGLGVCETIVRCMVDEGLDYDRARANFWVMDEHGLIGHTRQNM
jgi:hypothetical protein